MKNSCIGICHGQNCRDVGGEALTEQLHRMHIACVIIPCQSLCTYAPTAKVNEIAILHATLDKITEASDSYDQHRNN
ncbi:MAG: hypothetical protein CO186_06330 [Zetaproteobacteria bacterium CG_4_9_14_3_um_filter_49_83]|nr:MAG: hypothetical protein AUJ56_11670 [Zetaproteobacteria bacterium CG1_02_49_23]PIQ34160.1 MAG: hypothetical protein COW62_02805 [Zetaproteobacteria bacterium CG17_big_fil_post_rev_8_21_14_2_50_50_13]PIV31222.1 MAG: hypothetical protein COS35_02500 [Zetaproteobacteria bacterium CG02_land_8_20_14_3_00_50_9]PIY56935.1 MAG: hypothetical protein COZ00_01480 [Zetaproteobacteria bacterium CG_4_10_14_0_8_um_filter_49_80]PJA35332.1 MAG: hypothetical protein CO186_06330 [Zetaproteobacteria bacterium